MSWRVPLPFAAALRWFLRRLGLGKEAQAEIEARAAERAKAAAAQAQLALVQQAWEAAERAERAGIPIAVFRADLIQTLRAGWGKTGYRTDLVFAVQAQHGYSSSRTRTLLLESVRRIWPYWMFEAILDERTSNLCDSLNGVIRPAGESWWDRRTPPLHPRCRSALRGLSLQEAHTRGITMYFPEGRASPGWGLLQGEYEPAESDVPAPLWRIFRRALGKTEE